MPYCTSLKILNLTNKNKIIIYGCLIILAIFCGIVKGISNSVSSIICLVLLIALLFSKDTKNSLGHSILVNIISLSINYSIFIIAVVIGFIPFTIFNIRNDYVNLLIIVFIHIAINTLVFRTIKIIKGITFLQKNLQSQYWNILTLNISVILVFAFMVLSSLDKEITRSMFIRIHNNIYYNVCNY